MGRPGNWLYADTSPCCNVYLHLDTHTCMHAHAMYKSIVVNRATAPTYVCSMWHHTPSSYHTCRWTYEPSWRPKVVLQFIYLCVVGQSTVSMVVLVLETPTVTLRQMCCLLSLDQICLAIVHILPCLNWCTHGHLCPNGMIWKHLHK